MKKIVILLLVASFVFSISTNSVYADEMQIISYEEYSSALIEKFEEHGRSLEIEPLDKDFVYTKELLEQELIKAEEYLAKPLTVQCIDSDMSLSEKEENGISPASMLGTVRCSYSNLIVFSDTVVPTACCTVKSTATINVDYQRDYVISGEAPTLELRNGVNMDDYVRLNSYTTHISNADSNVANRYISYDINAQFKLDYSVIGVTAWEKVDKTFYVIYRPFS